MTQWFTENWRLKAVALGLALVTWFFVKSITSDSRTVENVPLEINVKPGMTLVDASASSVAVTVRGTREDIRQSSRAELSAVLDLTHADRTGIWTARVERTAIRHPPRVQVTEVHPGLVVVHVDQIAEREVPVKLTFTGELPAGLEIEQALARPQTVRLRGPRSLLDALRNIETLPIDLTGRRAAFRERVDLGPESLSITPVARRWVEADIRIVESAIDKPPGAVIEKRP